VDLRFGEYLRALITADTELSPTDKWSYRNAFVQGFFRRGIYPTDATNLSPKHLCWEPPCFELPLDSILSQLTFRWDYRLNRRIAFDLSRQNALKVHQWISEELSDDMIQQLGIIRLQKGSVVPWQFDGTDCDGILHNFEVHSVRSIRRTGPGPESIQQFSIVIEIIQTWVANDTGRKFRGGSTLLIDMSTRKLKYLIRKRTGQLQRIADQNNYLSKLAADNPEVKHFGIDSLNREPFAMTHRML
jgi:hypothetical protein